MLCQLSYWPACRAPTSSAAILRRATKSLLLLLDVHGALAVVLAVLLQFKFFAAAHFAAGAVIAVAALLAFEAEIFAHRPLFFRYLLR